jgi:AcrR family transcriptional regulator
MTLLDNDVTEGGAMEDEAPRSKRRRAATREQLISSAEASFLARGYHGSSVGWLASEAGFTTGAVYSSVGDKARLFLAVLDRRSDRQLETWRAAAASANPEREVSLLLRRQLEEPQAREWHSAYFEFVAVAVRDPELQAALSELLDRSFKGLLEALEPLTRDASIPAKDFAELIHATTNGLGLVASIHNRNDVFDLMPLLISKLRAPDPEQEA